MRTTDLRRSLGIGLAILAAIAAAPHGASASNVNVQATAYQTVKGWGGFSFIYNQPTTAEATVVAQLGINVGRIEVRPELRNSDGSWNAAALATLEGWVGKSRNSGVANYMLDVWSPPTVWKTTGNTNTGSLIAGDEQAYANWYVSVIQKLQTDGYGTPISVSMQNEPDVDTGGSYYMCQYNTPSQLFTLQQDMRTALSNAGLSSVKVLGVESSGYCKWQPGCSADYMGNDPFTALQNSTYLNSMDAYCVHSYDQCGITFMRDGMAAYPKDAWETEFSYPFPDASSELAMAVSTARDMMANLVALPFNYWFWWALWDPSVTAPSATALIGENNGVAVVGARYYMLQKIWTTLTPGWITLHCTTDDSELLPTSVGQNCSGSSEPLCDMLAWKNSGGTASAVLIANQYSDSKTISVNGLLGSTATFFRTSSTENMAQVSSGSISGGSYSITLPSNTVGFVVTSGSGGAPPAPTGLTATAGNSQVALTWNASSGATAYDVKRSTVNGSGYATVSSPTTTSYTNTGLTNGTTYYFVVDAKNSSGTSGNSNQASATPEPAIPPAPTGLTATGGNTQVALSWTASSGATSYNVYRGTSAGGESGTAIATGISATNYTNTGLINGTAYYFTVKAVNGGGTSGASNEASATPSSGGTSGPVKINAGGPAVSPFVADVDYSGGTAYTNWTGAIDTSAVTNPAPQAVYQPERFGAMTYTMGGLTANANYTVRLHMCENYFTVSGARVFNVTINSTQVLTNFDIYATTGAIHKATCQQFTAAANGSGQIIVSFVNVTNNALVNGIEVNTITIPSAPTGLTATPGNAQVALSWTASSGATSYNVLCSTVSGSGYASVATGISPTNYTNTGLTNGTTYYFVVTATNAGGTSGNSNQASATPQVPAPPAPTGLTATPGNAQVALSWTASSGATSYNVLRSTVSGSGYASVATGISTTSYTNTGLTNGTTYYFVVTATNAGGTSGNSNQASATPSAGGPPAPTGLAATAGNTQACLTWTASSGATSYNILRSTVNGSGYASVGTGITNTTFYNTGLTNGTAYYYVAQAVNSGGTSGNSSQASVTPGAAPQAQIVHATTAPVIDGNVDTIWSSATAYAPSNIVTTLPAGANLSANWKGLWDSNNLYLLVTVLDSTLIANTDPTYGDSAEVYIDGDNNKSTSYDSNDWQFVFPWNSSTVEEFSGGTKGTHTTGIVFGQVNITGGYRIELSIPWSTIGVTAAANNLVGIDLAIDDSNVLGTKACKIFWNSTADNDWTNPSLFGTGKLLP